MSDADFAKGEQDYTWLIETDTRVRFTTLWGKQAEHDRDIAVPLLLLEHMKDALHAGHSCGTLIVDAKTQQALRYIGEDGSVVKLT